MQHTAEGAFEVAKTGRMLQLVKEHRIEAMIVTILLYSTGMLDKAFAYGAGVC